MLFRLSGPVGHIKSRRSNPICAIYSWWCSTQPVCSAGKVEGTQRFWILFVSIWARGNQMGLSHWPSIPQEPFAWRTLILILWKPRQLTANSWQSTWSLSTSLGTSSKFFWSGEGEISGEPAQCALAWNLHDNRYQYPISLVRQWLRGICPTCLSSAQISSSFSVGHF